MYTEPIVKPEKQADITHFDQAVADDELARLLDVLPPAVSEAVLRCPQLEGLIEIVLDLGRPAEVRFFDQAVYFEDIEVGRAELDYVIQRLGHFTGDNRAGIERTLHRISAIRNRREQIIGLTCRVGRAVTGTVEIIRDVIETGKGLLLLGPPGVGKTTLLREAARVLAGDLGKRVVIVDTSNEIGGDGDVPHSGIGRARRMQVPAPELQHKVMIEAVENHMPEVIVIDEIGTLPEALAARTIAERGVQLVGTAHGITLDNLITNPTLSDLIGGIQAVTLSDEEARRRGTQKTVLERKARPTFDMLVEIQHRDRLAVYRDLAKVVDRVLAGVAVSPEIRSRELDGTVVIESGRAQQRYFTTFDSDGDGEPAAVRMPVAGYGAARKTAIYPIGVNRTRLEQAIRELGVHARLADQPINADVVLSLKAQRKRQPKKLQQALRQGVEFYSIKSNTFAQVKGFLRNYFGASRTAGGRRVALEETEDAVVRVQRGTRPVELAPQNSFIRRQQHELVHRHGLHSESRGRDPNRRVVVLPGSE